MTQRYPSDLTSAIRSGAPERIRTAVQRHGAAVLNQARADGLTSLGIALTNDQDASLEVLLALGADPNADFARCDGPPTPLLLAIVCGSGRGVDLLLRSGADVNESRPTAGWASPLLESAMRHQFGLALRILECNPNIEATDRDGRTALHAAAEEGSPELARALVARGAPIEARMHDTRTPLVCAIDYGREEVVDLLLRHGANSQVRIKQQMTPLHVAAAWDLDTLCAQLLRYGAEPDARDLQGRTAAEVARCRGHDTLADWLSTVERHQALKAPGAGEAHAEHGPAL